MGSCRRASNSASFLHRDPDDDSYTGSDVWRLIGGSLHDTCGPDSPGGTQNSCAARASYALNRCGCAIPHRASRSSRRSMAGAWMPSRSAPP